MMTRREKLFVVFGGIVFLALVGARVSFQSVARAERRPRLIRQEFRSDEFRPLSVVRPYDPIENPPFVDAAEAKLQPNELVLGTAIDGVARAYPINMLTGPSREIFNDTLGERPIAATW